MTDLEQLARIICPEDWQTVEELGITPETDPRVYRVITAKSLAIAQAIHNAGWTPPVEPATPSYLDN